MTPGDVNIVLIFNGKMSLPRPYLLGKLHFRMYSLFRFTTKVCHSSVNILIVGYLRIHLYLESIIDCGMFS